MENRAGRRLAAILAADIAGYSQLIGRDEEGTISELRRLRSEVIDPVIAQHGGRIANTAGDSFLIEFRSAVDAVRAAVEIQAQQAARNAQADAGAALTLRIGLNVGDVVSQGDDILGDGVNVAARLEALAEPGGILVSQAVADYAQSNVAVGFVPIGPQKVKNIANPVEAFRIDPDAPVRAPAPAAGRMRKRMLTGVAVLALTLGGLFLTQPWQQDRILASQAAMLHPLPDLPSVAVLPVTNLSGEATNDVLTDGISEDLITDLSRISGLFVIAGNTSFAYRDRQVTIADFAEELGVRYVVDGSLRRTGADFRFNIRLTDALNGRLVWAERFDGDIGDLFDVQNRIVLNIAAEMNLKLDPQSRTAIESPETRMIEAREAFQRGWELYSRFNEADNLAAIPHFESALALDPGYDRARAMLALAHLRPHIFHHWNGFAQGGEQMHIGLFYRYYREVAREDTALAHIIRANVSLNLPDWDGAAGKSRGTDEAIQQAARAIALSPSDPEAHLTMGWSMIASGRPQEGLAFVQAAKRLDPEYPSHYILIEAAAYFAMNDLPRAETALRTELERNPQAIELMPVAASVLALKGDLVAARAMTDLWQKGEHAGALQEVVQEYFFIIRWIGEHQHLNARLKNGLKLAALPRGTTIASLRAELSGSDAGIQRKAARTLALFGPGAAAAVPELTSLLNSPSVFVRKDAAIALGEIGPAARSALPALEAVADGSLSGSFAARAAEQIRGLTPQD